MPTEKSIGLHNVQGLLPELGKPGQDDQAKTIIVGQQWPVRLPLENDQLLPEYGIFN